jgi:hypothetical protein
MGKLWDSTLNPHLSEGKQGVSFIDDLDRVMI